jgi:hypothetical protein
LELPVIEELLGRLVDSWISGKSTSKRTEVVLRVFLGLLGVALSLAGVYHMLGYDAGWHFRLAAAAMLFFSACFCTFNVALLLPWR